MIIPVTIIIIDNCDGQRRRRRRWRRWGKGWLTKGWRGNNRRPPECRCTHRGARVYNTRGRPVAVVAAAVWQPTAGAHTPRETGRLPPFQNQYLAPSHGFHCRPHGNLAQIFSQGYSRHRRSRPTNASLRVILRIRRLRCKLRSFYTSRFRRDRPVCRSLTHVILYNFGLV